MAAADIAVIAVLVVLWCAFSSRLERFDLSAPIVFVVAGFLLGGSGTFGVALTSDTVKLLAEATLALVLFADASRVTLRSLRDDLAPPVRLLGIGMPLMVVLGAGLAAALFPGSGWAEALLIGAVLAPTDAGLGAGIISDTRVPGRVRRMLDVESGLNDGLAAPAVAIALAALASEHGTAGVLGEAARELAVGAALGVAIGVAGGFVLSRSRDRGWAAPGTEHLATFAVAVGTYAGAVAVHGNGFVAAFLAGLAFGPFARRNLGAALDLTEQSGQLLASVVWFVFGAAMLRVVSGTLTWEIVLYAVLSLTVVRAIAVSVSLIGTRLGVPTVLFVSWFGPRGLASIVFALLAYDALGAESGPLLAVVTVTVLLSVVAHGASARPLIDRYARAMGEAPVDHPSSAPAPEPVPRRPLGRFHLHHH